MSKKVLSVLCRRLLYKNDKITDNLCLDNNGRAAYQHENGRYLTFTSQSVWGGVDGLDQTGTYAKNQVKITGCPRGQQHIKLDKTSWTQSFK